MKPVIVSETIQATQESVFTMASDIPNFSNNISGIIKVEQLTDGPVKVGTRWRETRIMFGKEATEEMEFVKIDPPNSYEVRAESHGSRYTTIFQFEKVGAGTKMTVSFSAEAQSLLAKIMSVIMGPFMKGSLAKLLLQDLKDIKVNLEKG